MAFSDDDFKNQDEDAQAEKIASVMAGLMTAFFAWLFAFAVGVLVFTSLISGITNGLWIAAGFATVFALICGIVVYKRKANYDQPGPKHGGAIRTFSRIFLGRF